jgi:hypothetical protein
MVSYDHRGILANLAVVFSQSKKSFKLENFIRFIKKWKKETEKLSRKDGPGKTLNGLN